MALDTTWNYKFMGAFIQCPSLERRAPQPNPKPGPEKMHLDWSRNQRAPRLAAQRRKTTTPRNPFAWGWRFALHARPAEETKLRMCKSLRRRGLHLPAGMRLRPRVTRAIRRGGAGRGARLRQQLEQLGERPSGRGRLPPWRPCPACP